MGVNAIALKFNRGKLTVYSTDLMTIPANGRVPCITKNFKLPMLRNFNRQPQQLTRLHPQI